MQTVSATYDGKKKEKRGGNATVVFVLIFPKEKEKSILVERGFRKIS